MSIIRFVVPVLALAVWVSSITNMALAQSADPAVCANLLDRIKAIEKAVEERSNLLMKAYKQCMNHATTMYIIDPSPKTGYERRQREDQLKCESPMEQILQMQLDLKQNKAALMQTFQKLGCPPPEAAKPSESPGTGSSGSPTVTSAPPGAPPAAALKQAQPGSPTAAQALAVTFQPGGGSRMPEEVAEELQVPAEKRAEIVKIFRTFLSSYEKEARQEKLPHNVARAYAYFVAINLEILGNPGLNSGQFQELVRTATLTLAGDAKFAKLGNKEKEALYEWLVLRALVTAVGYREGQKKQDNKEMETYRKMARLNLKTLGWETK